MRPAITLRRLAALLLMGSAGCSDLDAGRSLGPVAPTRARVPADVDATLHEQL